MYICIQFTVYTVHAYIFSSIDLWACIWFFECFHHSVLYMHNLKHKEIIVSSILYRSSTWSLNYVTNGRRVDMWAHTPHKRINSAIIIPILTFVYSIVKKKLIISVAFCDVWTKLVQNKWKWIEYLEYLATTTNKVRIFCVDCYFAVFFFIF